MPRFVSEKIVVSNLQNCLYRLQFIERNMSNPRFNFSQRSPWNIAAICLQLCRKLLLRHFPVASPFSNIPTNIFICFHVLSHDSIHFLVLNSEHTCLDYRGKSFYSCSYIGAKRRSQWRNYKMYFTLFNVAITTIKHPQDAQCDGESMYTKTQDASLTILSTSANEKPKTTK